MFLSDLVKKLTFKCKIDFVKISSYHNNKQVENLKISIDLKYDIKDIEVIVIEDIIDTGKSLHNMLKLLNQKDPKRIKVYCYLGHKNT